MSAGSSSSGPTAMWLGGAIPRRPIRSRSSIASAAAAAAAPAGRQQLRHHRLWPHRHNIEDTNVRLVRFNEGRIGVLHGDRVHDATAAVGLDVNAWPPVGMIQLIHNFAAVK